MAFFGHVLTAMVTPFTEDKSVDYVMAKRLARHLIENGSDGIVVAGTTGESPTLTETEKIKLFETVLEEVGNEAKVVAGTGTYSTAESISMTKAAERAGVHGAMLVAPYYSKPPQSGLYEHFSAIAKSTGLPLIIYNIPGRTGINILPETMARIAQIDNVVAVKESSGSLEQVSEIRRTIPDSFSIYSGDDSLTLPMLSVGADGIISVASHIAGKEIKEMVLAFLSGDVQKATAIHLRLMPLFKVLFITANPIPVKAACIASGLPVGGLRLPLVDATEDEKNRIFSVIRALGFLD